MLGEPKDYISILEIIKLVQAEKQSNREQDSVPDWLHLNVLEEKIKNWVGTGIDIDFIDNNALIDSIYLINLFSYQFLK